ncbi:hypothetical protein AL755_06285 [Arthrobacter sp. ERGS1:01]|uniref:hypothetical protein n=1 Tax=Arthrobacter sp. ERGS1:01 TaxID=1704044 RepID=UPI0006B585BB|nr:hypothetical protein [Arthrobacter sp. ERGS1:01]ALE05178.1 hypothetical protein AL755_06285 [Arthrobacter sp. ERGS1:01]
MSNGSYQRENSLTQTIILFVIFFALFLGGIFSMSFWDIGSANAAFMPGIIGIGLCFLSLVIPLTWIGRSNSAGE